METLSESDQIIGANGVTIPNFSFIFITYIEIFHLPLTPLGDLSYSL